jgi:hypothetical protein
MPPSSGSKNLILPPACFLLVSCFLHCLTQIMEGTYSYETSVKFYRTTRSYFPDDATVHIHGCEDLKSSVVFLKLCI